MSKFLKYKNKVIKLIIENNYNIKYSIYRSNDK